MKKLFTISTIIFCCICGFGQPGQLHNGFGGTGWVNEDFIQSNYNSESVLKIFPEINGTNVVVMNSALSRFFADGKLDRSFGKNGFLNMGGLSASSTVQQADGKILLPRPALPGSSYLYGIRRYNGDGTIDSTFGQNGIQSNGFSILKINIQKDGKIVIAGFNGGLLSIARLNTDGSPDVTFVQDVTTGPLLDHIYSLLIQSDGTILVDGTLYELATGCQPCDPEGGDVYNILAFNNNGSVKTGFHYGGYESGTLALQNDDKLLLDSYYNGLKRYNPDGSVDPTFHFDPFNPSYSSLGGTTSIAFQNDGKILLTKANYSSSNTLPKDFILVRYTQNGSLDSTFDGDGIATTDFGNDDIAYSLVVQNDGTLLVGGSAVGATNSDYAFASYKSDGSINSNFLGGGKFTGFIPVSVGGKLNTIAIQTDGKIVTAGEVRDSVYKMISFISRYNADGTPDYTFNGTGKQVTGIGDSNLTVNAISIQPDGKIVAGGTVFIPNSVYIDSGYFFLMRYNINGSLDSSFGTNGIVVTNFGKQFIFASLYAVAIQYDGKIVAAGSVGGFSYASFTVVRYNPDGSVDSSFGMGGKRITNIYNTTNICNSLALQNDHKIVLAGTSGANGNSYFGTIRYNEDGILDNSFDIDGKQIIDFGSNTVSGGFIGIQNDGKIVIAGTTIDNSTQTYSYAVIRYKIDGSLDSTFGTDGKTATAFNFKSAAAESIDIQSDDKIIVTGLISRDPIFSDNDIAITRYNSNGILDSSFGNNGQVISDFGNNERAQASAIYNNVLYVAGTNVIAAYDLGIQSSTSLSCPSPQTVSNDREKCSAVVASIDPVLTDSTLMVNYALTGATTLNGMGSASGLTFNQGATTVTYALANDPSATCSFNVTVNDSEAPRMTKVNPLPDLLWPVDNKLRSVYLDYQTKDNCSAPACKISVTSSQDISNDWGALNDHLIKLRATRNGSGERIYTITVTCTDAAGNATSKSTKVRVPKSRGSGNNQNIENGSDPLFDYVQGFGIKAFPNPSSNYFNLQLTGNNYSDRINLKVYDISGRLVEVMNDIAPGKTIILGASLHKGMYIAEIRQGKDVQHIKLIKKAGR